MVSRMQFRDAFPSCEFLQNVVKIMLTIVSPVLPGTNPLLMS